MSEFVCVVSDPLTGKAYRLELKGKKADYLVGKKIGDIVDGEPIGLPGYKLMVTGGTDKDGFPMRPDVHGTARKAIILSGPPGFHPKRKGERRRKMVRGNVISREIRQVNLKVVEITGNPPSLEQLLGKEEKKKE